MTDQPDFELEAASAVADDLASAEERALVDASPALRADVEAFRELRVGIAAVEVPTGVRDSAIAVALAALDEGVQSPAAATPTVVSLDSRRRRQWGVLVGAAAAVAVLAIGAVMVGTRGSDDDAASDVAATSAGAATVAPSPLRTEGEVATEGPGADPAGAFEADEAEPALDASGKETSGTGSPWPAPAETAAPDELILDVPAQLTPAIASATDLLSYASSPLTYSSTAGDSPDQAADTFEESTTADTTAATTADPAPVAADSPVETDAPGTLAAEMMPRAIDLCVSGESEYVGMVLYRGVLAHVVRVVDTDEVRALAADDCRLLISATP